MQLRESWIMALAALLACACAMSARADVITFAFGGTIAEVEGDNDFLAGAVSLGDSFSGNYMFESDTPDYRPGNPTIGVYFALLDISGEIGSLGYMLAADTEGSLVVANNFSSPPEDGYEVGITVEIDDQIWELRIDLADFTASAWSSDALPENPPDLDLFSSKTFRLYLESENVELTGPLTYLVPEPGSILLLILGVAVVQIAFPAGGVR